MDNSFDIHSESFDNTERDFESALRPLAFESFSGQDKIVENLRIFVSDT